MKQPEYSPLEALERIKLMMKYDMSKTLNENKEVISEQPTKNGMSTASKVESFFNSCSTQAKNLKQVASDSQIISAAESINKAIEGLQTDEDLIKSAIESMGNVADLCALKTKYDARYGSLYEDLDGDINGTDWKTYVWAPMQTIIEKSAEEIKNVTKVKSNTKAATKYKPCSGTYTQGCYSEVIKQVQGCLGGLVADGKFGSKTNEKLKTAGFTSGFSDNDVDKICNKTKTDDIEDVDADNPRTI
jgi:hypothetical protein